MNETIILSCVIGVMAALLVFVAGLLRRANREIREYEASFELYWKASQRGIALWQQENPGNDMTWPDQGKLICWLMTHHDGLRRRAEEQSQAAVDLFDECQRLKQCMNTQRDEDLREIERLTAEIIRLQGRHSTQGVRPF